MLEITYWATLNPLSCAVTYRYGAPWWAMRHPLGAHMGQLTLTELRCTLLSYWVPYWTMLYPTELPNTLWAMLHPNWATYSTFVQFLTCRNAGLSGTGMLRYRTEMLDAGIPMPAASASMPMPSYVNYLNSQSFSRDTLPLRTCWRWTVC